MISAALTIGLFAPCALATVTPPPPYCSKEICDKKASYCETFRACQTTPDGHQTCLYDVKPDCCDYKHPSCDDYKACTKDSCNYATHTCKHKPIEDCCEVDDDCYTGDGCSLDTCDNTTNTCQHVLISCPQKPCKEAGCAAGHCAYTPSPNGSECTRHNGDAGVCYHGHCKTPCGPEVCNKKAPACKEFDYCNGNKCVYKHIDGCCKYDSDCDDGDNCSADTCGEDHTCSYIFVDCLEKECNSASCAPDATCMYTPFPDGTECTLQVGDPSAPGGISGIAKGKCRHGVCKPPHPHHHHHHSGY